MSSNSYKNLRNAVFKDVSSGRNYLPHHMIGDPHVFALVSHAFKGRKIIQESFFGDDHYLAHEALARPKATHKLFLKSDYKKHLNMQDISDGYYDSNAHIEFDTLLCKNALYSADKFPVTLNISVKSALSDNFWQNIEEDLQCYAPEDIIFEILEHDVNVNANISHLGDLHDLGYRFLLDDYNVIPSTGGLEHSSKHEKLLCVFGDLVMGIKIDGSLVRAGLGDERNEKVGIIHYRDNFHDLVTKFNNDFSDKIIIAERVYNPDEAAFLHKECGIDYVQGRDLRHEDFNYPLNSQKKPHSRNEGMDLGGL